MKKPKEIEQKLSEIQQELNKINKKFCLSSEDFTKRYLLEEKVKLLEWVLGKQQSDK